MTTASATARTNHNRGGFAAADSCPEPRRAGYGAAPPASRVLRIALRATGLRPALDPGDLCGPWTGEQRGQARGLPPMARGALQTTRSGVSTVHSKMALRRGFQGDAIAERL